MSDRRPRPEYLNISDFPVVDVCDITYSNVCIKSKAAENKPSHVLLSYICLSDVPVAHWVEQLLILEMTSRVPSFDCLTLLLV